MISKQMFSYGYRAQERRYTLYQTRVEHMDGGTLRQAGGDKLPFLVVISLWRFHVASGPEAFAGCAEEYFTSHRHHLADLHAALRSVRAFYLRHLV